MGLSYEFARNGRQSSKYLAYSLASVDLRFVTGVFVQQAEKVHFLQWKD